MHKLLLAGVSAIALVLTGISGASAQDLKFPKGEGAFSWQALDDFAAAHKGLEGQKLTIWGPWREGGDKEQFESVLAYFKDATGIDVSYASSENYEQQAVIDTAAGSAANITILPQPGLLADLASKGYLTPLGDDLAAKVKDEYAAGESWVSLGTYKGKDGNPAFFAVPYKADLKSLVWYSPDNFAEKGYKVPETFEDLMALSKQIIADGGTPWCIGLGSGGATGWPATDWIEDIMLRTQSPEDYDKWVTNELKFNDPKVVAALDVFGEIAKDDKMVAGGAKAVGTTDFRDSPKGLFTVPPQCYLHHQASFIPSFFPEGTELGTDASFFYFPPFADKNLGKPVLGAGTLVTITKDSPTAKAFIDFVQNPISNEIWMAQSGFLSPLKSANIETYGNDTLKGEGQILLDATTFRFDGSDMMPGAIGAGAFWTGMVDFVNGKSSQDVADEIQKAWDSIKK
ncbi:ABC transporter substrate-binding protein [Paradevosia shaoguanensis]|uniref:ABC transporter substrate-binding protein n=1 Tax=Paradevosia shaoguanensis TaxID=1335043 RepID=A0AA41UA48_9HYPH|nr:ABC transporter substrate-binding protein [Paradevosia shaoguanensis]MCF1741557.1 ABC transporter substrate-binding protein [Paradevosia shaoguanensis]MCI0126040.1 ABC transporter substrate-binding protein [Paradevosia shaoguanensis]